MTAPAIFIPAAAAAASCVMALLIAYFYMERYLLLEPCPLCILDRIAVAAMAVGFAATAYWRQRRLAWLSWSATTLALAAGLLFAGRHIWLQNRPPDITASCLADSAAAEGLVNLVRRAFDASADCGAIMWEFAGVTIPEQVLALFVALAAVQLWLAAALWRQEKAWAT